MKKAFLLAALAACIAAVGFIGCDNPAGGEPPLQKGDVDITAANLGDMKSLIAAESGGASADDPLVVAISGGVDLSGTNSVGDDPLHMLFDAIPDDKYVAYDLSGCTFTSIGDIDYTIANARTSKNRLVSIILPDTLTSIGIQAFQNCSNLVSVAIPDGVTSIGSSAFYNCSSLASVAIPDGVTSIGIGAFRNCSNLTSVIIPAGVTSIGYSVFSYCTKLTAIQVSGNNNYYKDSDGVLFNKAGTLLSEYPAGKGGSIYTIPDSVTSLGEAAFRICSNLTSVTIPDGVTSIGSFAFDGCSSLTSVIIPAGVTSIGSSAFWRCTSLTSVTVLRGTTPLTILESSAFDSTHATLAIKVPASVLDDYKAASGWSTYAAKIVAITP
jgi:hypothetical protein